MGQNGRWLMFITVGVMGGRSAMMPQVELTHTFTVCEMESWKRYMVDNFVT